MIRNIFKMCQEYTTVPLQDTRIVIVSAIFARYTLFLHTRSLHALPRRSAACCVLENCVGVKYLTVGRKHRREKKEVKRKYAHSRGTQDFK